MNIFKNFIVTLITVFVMGLWGIPIWIKLMLPTADAWGLLYLPIAIVSISWFYNIFKYLKLMD